MDREHLEKRGRFKVQVQTVRQSVDLQTVRNRPGHSEGRRPVGTPRSFISRRALPGMATLGFLVFLTVLLGPRPSAAAPVSVRFAEGVTHGFLALRTINGVPLASGDVL